MVLGETDVCIYRCMYVYVYVGERWWGVEFMQVPPRPNTYMPFGNGVHSCPGSELAKLELLVLLHHLTLSYRFLPHKYHMHIHHHHHHLIFYKVFNFLFTLKSRVFRSKFSTFMIEIDHYITWKIDWGRWS